MGALLPLRRRLSRLLRRVARVLDLQESEAEARIARLRRRFPDAPETWIAAVAAYGEPSGPMQAARLSLPPIRPAPATQPPWQTAPNRHPEARDLRDGLSLDTPPAPSIAPSRVKPPRPRLVWDHVAPRGPAPERVSFHGRHPPRPAPAAHADPPPPPSPATAPITPPPEHKLVRSHVEFHPEAASGRYRPAPRRQQGPGTARVDATARKADFPALRAEQERQADPPSFVLPEGKASLSSIWPSPPLTLAAGASFPSLSPPAPGLAAEASFPDPVPRPAAPPPLPPPASRPAPVGEAAPEIPHPWPALPTQPVPPAPQATGRWAEPLPDQEGRGWSA